MSFLASLPGAKGFAKVASKGLDKFEQTSEAVHNAFMPINVRDDDVDYDAPQSKGAKIIEQFREQVRKGSPFNLSPQMLVSLIDALRHSTAIDDRKMLLEHVLVMMSRLPNGDLAAKLKDQVVELLFFDLPHPPATYMGNQYRWRTADGSYNNVNIPNMGKAGSPYSRSVQATHPLNPTELPDPVLIYKALMKRDKFVPHPSGLSSLMFGFATLVIHSIFRTSFTDTNINETSSYVDLAPLYGNDQAMQDAVRTSPKDGRGTLKPDTFAEDRLLLLPPASAVILILFNRNHNYIARKLLEINERGTFVPPEKLQGDDPATVKKRLAQDEEIFQITRLINATWFAQVVFSDYFSSILGLVRDGSSWSLDPFGQIRKDDHSLVERGQGNSVSVEFNLLYRWHPTMSVQDEQWTEGVFRQLFGNKPFDQITFEEFGMTLGKLQKQESKDPANWMLPGINRHPENENRFADEDLARVLKTATSHPASAFKARGSPAVMQVIEVMGIRLGRSWGVCSLNDFRRFLGLKPYADFDEWNPDPEIANTARKLYGDIENLELYPGLQAEEAKPVVPGAGLCPPYTTSRAILADAIALTRGDRFFTADFTPWNLTTWGFQDCQRDTNNAGFGSMLGRLFLRTLPNHYTANSTYTWFPLMTPEAMQDNLTKLGIVKSYSFDMPGQTYNPVAVTKFKAVKAILQDRAAFGTKYVERAKEVMQGSGYLLSVDDSTIHQDHLKLIQSTIVDDPLVLQNAEAFFYAKTRDLIKDNSYTLSGNEGQCIDIVDDVLNMVPIYFVSAMITGIPMKSTESPHASYMPREMMQMLRDIFSYVFFEPEPAKALRAQHLATSHAQELLGHIKSNIRPNGGSGLFSAITSLFSSSTQTNDFLQKLAASKKPKDELANHALSVALIAGVEFAQDLANVVDFYLRDANADHKINLMKIARVGGTSTDAMLQGYVREALRLDPTHQGVVRHAKTSYDAHGVSVGKTQHVFLNFTQANLDPEAFPNPTKVELSRPAEEYLSLHHAVYGMLGHDFVHKTMAQVLRAVFGLKNVRRSPGSTGTLRRIVTSSTATAADGIATYLYLDNKSELVPWAKSMILQYDN